MRHLTIDHRFDLRLGRGLYRFRVIFHGRKNWLVRVPLLGKAWSFQGGGRGRMGWTAVKAERPSLED